MTPDEAVDAVMRGPFEDTHDGERLPPPSPEVERAARRFLRALLARRPLVTFSTHYDAMEGIEVLVGGDGYGVSVSMLNCGWAFLVGPRSIARGPVRIGDATLDGHVLDDGRRVFSARDLVRAISPADGGKDGDFDRWIERIPNAPADLKLVARIEFEIPGAPNGLGYPVEILTRVCRAYIRAEREGRLHHKQRHIADQAWRLLEALGDVGLVALVDEATGYQNARAANDLQNRLALYLLPTPGRWEVTFPPEFYKLVARLYRVRLLHPSRRPQFFANFTREYVYAPAMGADVSQAMAARNPDPAHGHNHHQLLTGPARAMVLEQRNRVMTLLRQSSTPDEFRARYRVEFHGAPLQLALVN